MKFGIKKIMDMKTGDFRMNMTTGYSRRMPNSRWCK